MSEKKAPEDKQKDEATDTEEEDGYYCIYCGDFVKKGQYHHH